MEGKPSAFIGHSFAKCDSQTVAAIMKFIDAQGIHCVSGEDAENKSIAEKVRNRILENDLFIGIFTKVHTLTDKPNIFKKIFWDIQHLTG